LQHLIYNIDQIIDMLNIQKTRFHINELLLEKIEFH